MALIEFEDLPSTNTAINANNLNNNFDELNTNIEGLIDKEIYNDTYTVVSGNIGANSWNNIVQSKNITLTPGKYLFVFRANIQQQGSTVGLATIRVMFDTVEVRRTTIPMGHGLVTTALITYLADIQQEQTISTVMQAYLSSTATASAGGYQYIKLN